MPARKIQLVGENVENRKTLRSKTYLSEQMVVRISNSHFQASCHLVDFTPFGFGVVSELDESQIDLQVNDSVQILIEHQKFPLQQEGTIVNRRSVIWNDKRYTRLGISLNDTPQDRDNVDSRVANRFKIGDLGAVIVTCKDPTAYNQQAFMQLEDMSIRGVLLSTSSRNKFLQPGSRHTAQLAIPGIGNFVEDLVVRHIRIADEGKIYKLGCEFIQPKAKTLQALAEFNLIFSPNASYQELRAEGFSLSVDSQAINVKSSEDPADYQAILHLRSQGYGESGTLGFKSTDPIESFGDHLDKYSRQIIAKIGSRIAGASRVVFTEGKPERSGLVHYEQFPDFLRGKKFVEFSKVCTRPEFRDGPILMRLIMEMFRITVLSKSEYVVIFCRDYLVKTYQRFGLKPHGESFEIAGHKMQFMFGNCEDLIRGRHTEFVPWSFGVAPVIQELQAANQLEIDWYTQLKTWVGINARPYMIDVLEKRIEQRLKKKTESKR